VLGGMAAHMPPEKFENSGWRMRIRAQGPRYFVRGWLAAQADGLLDPMPLR
jgi:hypothetical protein